MPIISKQRIKVGSLGNEAYEIPLYFSKLKWLKTKEEFLKCLKN